MTTLPGESYFTERFGAAWGVSDVVGPMTVVGGTRTVPAVPMSWGSVKARYR